MTGSEDQEESAEAAGPSSSSSAATTPSLTISSTSSLSNLPPVEAAGGEEEAMARMGEGARGRRGLTTRDRLRNEGVGGSVAGKERRLVRQRAKGKKGNYSRSGLRAGRTGAPWSKEGERRLTGISSTGTGRDRAVVEGLAGAEGWRVASSSVSPCSASGEGSSHKSRLSKGATSKVEPHEAS